MPTYISDRFDQFVPVSVFCAIFFFRFFACFFLVIHGFCACMGNISDVDKRHICMNTISLLNLVGQYCNIPLHEHCFLLCNVE